MNPSARNGRIQGRGIRARENPSVSNQRHQNPRQVNPGHRQSQRIETRDVKIPGRRNLGYRKSGTSKSKEEKSGPSTISAQRNQRQKRPSPGVVVVGKERGVSGYVKLHGLGANVGREQEMEVVVSESSGSGTHGRWENKVRSGEI